MCELPVSFLIDITNKEEYLIPNSESNIVQVILFGKPNPSFTLKTNNNYEIVIIDQLASTLHTLTIEGRVYRSSRLSIQHNNNFKNILFNISLDWVKMNGNYDFLYFPHYLNVLEFDQGTVNTLMYEHIKTIQGTPNIKNIAGTKFHQKWHKSKLFKKLELNDDVRLYNTHFNDCENGLVYGKFLIDQGGLVDLTENTKYMQQPQFNVTKNKLNHLIMGAI